MQTKWLNIQCYGSALTEIWAIEQSQQNMFINLLRSLAVDTFKGNAYTWCQLMYVLFKLINLSFEIMCNKVWIICIGIGHYQQFYRSLASTGHAKLSFRILVLVFLECFLPLYDLYEVLIKCMNNDQAQKRTNDSAV